MQDIKAWLLSAKQYSKGVDLYRKYGQSSIVLMQLEAAEHSLNRKLLSEKLTDLYSEIEDSAATPQYVVANAPIIEDKTLDAKIAPFYKRKSQLYREAGKLHAIELWSDDLAVRKKATVAIMEKMDENGVYWDTIRYFEKHGMLPNKKKGFQYLATKNAVELLKLRNNNRAYISKTKTKTGKMVEQDEKYRAFQAEIERRTIENQEIEKLNVI
jgi:hypothetical protein